MGLISSIHTVSEPLECFGDQALLVPYGPFLLVQVTTVFWLAVAVHQLLFVVSSGVFHRRSGHLHHCHYPRYFFLLRTPHRRWLPVVEQAVFGLGLSPIHDKYPGVFSLAALVSFSFLWGFEKDLLEGLEVWKVSVAMSLQVV